MITRIEALVDAIASLNGWHDPKSDAYQLRNPLLLKAFSPKHEKDETGRRRHKNVASGYDNSVLDARIKCSGKSHSKLTPTSTLLDLIQVYGQPITAGRATKNFLRAALNDDNIAETQPLGWFLEDSKE
jgi:hypothetical protein